MDSKVFGNHCTTCSTVVVPRSLTAFCVIGLAVALKGQKYYEFTKTHSGIFFKYSFHPETSKVERVALKYGKTLMNFRCFDIKVIAFSSKYQCVAEKSTNHQL